MDKLPEKHNPATPSKMRGSARDSLRATLRAWRPEYPAPASAEDLAAALAEADAELAPIDRKALAVLHKKTIELFTAPANWKDVAEFYFEALEDVPADLVESALKSVRLHRRYRTCPQPADLRAPIIDELDARRTLRSKIATALAKARREPPEQGQRLPPTAEQKARVSEIVSGLEKFVLAGPVK